MTLLKKNIAADFLNMRLGVARLRTRLDPVDPALAAAWRAISPGAAATPVPPDGSKSDEP
jgi:hypothetical protein